MKVMKQIFAILLFSTIGVSSITAAIAATPQLSLDKPPESLKQWYKPANKRQVWLHTMFRLRREMQAINEYAHQKDATNLHKWLDRLDDDYKKIADMVPEWESEIKPRLLSELEMFIEKKDFSRIGKTIDMIQITCDDCHKSYQPLVAASYRSPYYKELKIQGKSDQVVSFEENMEQLSLSVNRTLIALDDGNKETALKASQNLEHYLQNLGTSCVQCHKDDKYPYERILGKTTRQNLQSLQKTIKQGAVKDSKKLMGDIAVTVCARCHNTHRIVNDLRNTLMLEKK